MRWVVLGLALATAAGCGDDAEAVDGGLIVLFDAVPPDALVPDAFVCPAQTCGTSCVDTTTDPFHCGACDNGCTRAQECASSVCECPSAFMPATAEDPDASVGTFGDSGNIFARGSFTGIGGLEHRLTVRWDPETVLPDSGYDLATITDHSVSVRSNISGEGASGRFSFASGVLRFSRACDEGTTGTITGASLIETMGGPGGGAPVPDGCSFAGIDFAFDLGAACGSSVDAGILDAGPPDA